MPSLTIAGAVTDEGGAPISDAVIAVTLAPVPMPDIAALTDTQGHFVMGAPEPGTYELLVNAPGYPQRRVTVEVDASTVASLSIELRI